METQIAKPLVDGVVIADDHPLTVEILKTKLSDNNIGLNYYCAINGKEVLDCLARKSCRIVMMDYSMPVMDGFECTRQIRNLYKDIKIICISAFNDEETVREAFESGVDGFISKTEDTPEIIHGIKKVLKNERFISGKVKTAMAESALFKKPKEKPNYPVPTKRQIEVVQALSEGLTYEKAGKKIFSGESAVRSMLYRLFSIYGVNKSMLLVEIFKEMGVVK